MLWRLDRRERHRSSRHHAHGRPCPVARDRGCDCSLVLGLDPDSPRRAAIDWRAHGAGSLRRRRRASRRTRRSTCTPRDASLRRLRHRPPLGSRRLADICLSGRRRCRIERGDRDRIGCRRRRYDRTPLRWTEQVDKRHESSDDRGRQRDGSCTQCQPQASSTAPGRGRSAHCRQIS